jgi:hypothetical protein
MTRLRIALLVVLVFVRLCAPLSPVEKRSLFALALDVFSSFAFLPAVLILAAKQNALWRHLGRTVDEQIRWFKEAWRAAEVMRTRGADVRAVTAWALLGSFDWDSLVTRANGNYEAALLMLVTAWCNQLRWHQCSSGLPVIIPLTTRYWNHPVGGDDAHDCVSRSNRKWQLKSCRLIALGRQKQ